MPIIRWAARAINGSRKGLQGRFEMYLFKYISSGTEAPSFCALGGIFREAWFRFVDSRDQNARAEPTAIGLEDAGSGLQKNARKRPFLAKNASFWAKKGAFFAA
jgi:hypothetical protein